MKVLFSSTSGHGHIIPMLQLARAFVDGGHDVRWAAAAQALPLVAVAGVETVAAGASGGAEAALRGAVRTQALALPGSERAPFVFPRMFGEALTPPMARDLLGLARDWGPDLLVHEHAELAAPLVGALLGVPSVTHSFGTAVPVPILEDTAGPPRTAVARARPRRTAVRRLLPGRLPRHLPALGAVDAGRPHPSRPAPEAGVRGGSGGSGGSCGR